ncbi:MAG: 3-carboxy-cis,cis-muconate cycloisomerase [Pyrinomonadaceae bacterium]|nr:3-carboxy-cis,cis-muconate cycloisomerase [Pyrinomonadaceae bacterium]
MPEQYDEMFTTPEMAEIFSARTHVRQMLRFEAALARAEADVGIIPAEAADAIAGGCQVELFDVVALYREAATAGTLAIPLVRTLSTQVSDEGRAFVHFGATSQDTIDTALVLQMREGLDALVEGLLGVCEGCAKLAKEHRSTPMAGRTLLQHAVPITFGLKAARWLALTTRQLRSLRAQRRHSLTLQFGGAAGTLASLGSAGMDVAQRLADELKLPLPDLPWHAERDRIATIASALGVTAGAMAKIANDVVLLAQTDVGEVSEATAPGKGGSSAMPQKNNPVDAMMALASARLATGTVLIILSAMANEHERAVGGWQAEWAAIPNLFRCTSSAVDRVRNLVSELQVDQDRMRQNLERDNGLIMAESLSAALLPYLGREETENVVRATCKRALATGSTLTQSALEEPEIIAVLSPETINRALDPAAYFGSASVMIDRALAVYREAQSLENQ